MDSLLKDLAVSGLRVSKVHEFIQQLVDYDKVISDTLLLQLLKVFRENLGKNTSNTCQNKASDTEMYAVTSW